MTLKKKKTNIYNNAKWFLKIILTFIIIEKTLSMEICLKEDTNLVLIFLIIKSPLYLSI